VTRPLWFAIALATATPRWALAEESSADGGVTAASAGGSEAAAPSSSAVDEELSALQLLTDAEGAMLSVEYERSLRLAEAALAKGGLTRADTARAYRVLAIAAAQGGDTQRAEAAFLRLFALDPQSRVDKRLSPDRRGPVLSARGFWSVRQGAFGLSVRFDRRDKRLFVEYRDPIRWGQHVHVWYRFGQRPFVRAEQPAGATLQFPVSEELEAAEPLEVYGFATDDHGNVITEFADQHTPRVFALSEEERLSLALRDIRGGQTGSFGRRLEEQGARVGVHGYVTVELKEVNGKPSFDVHHATALFRAELLPAVSAEFGVEFEHLALSIQDVYLPHAFIDLQQSELLTARVGFFEAPIGAFNEYLYPDFLRTTGLAPLFTSGVVPALWSEVGVQARGRRSVARDLALTYAAFVSNGLEQRDADLEDGVVAEGGNLVDMRFNVRDRHSGNKAVGGRFGLEARELDFGISGYTGRYTIEKARQLSIVDVDASYRTRVITARVEAALAAQEVTDSTLYKYGGYALLAARPLPAVEPYAQYDFVKVDQRTHRGLLGVALYPFPTRGSTRTLRLKSEAGYVFTGSADPAFVWFEQLTASF
jgi:hypothetical protein